MTLKQSRKTLAAMLANKSQIESNASVAAQDLETIKRKLDAERKLQREVLTQVATTARTLAKADPNSRWATPPGNLPDWNGESPFVWIRKELVPKFGVPMFKSSGGLEPEVATVLAIDRAMLTAMNTKLEKVMADYHANEVSRAKRIEKHLSGVQGNGLKATIEIQPMGDVGAGFKEQFNAVVTEALGVRRSELVLQSSEGWFFEQFDGNANGTRTITVIRLVNGGFSVSTKSASSESSVGVDPSHPEMISYYIPAHLLPLFGDVLNPASSVGELK